MSKFLNRLRLCYKLFFQNTFLFSVSLLGLAGVIFFQVKEIKFFNYGPMYLVWRNMDLCILLFAFFAFLSYEYFYRVRSCQLSECIDATYKGEGRLYLSQLAVMITLALAGTLIPASFTAASYFIYMSGAPQVLIHTLLSYLLFILCPSLLAILLGMILALRLKRLSAYLMLVIVVMLAGPFSNSLVIAAFRLGFNGYRVLDFIKLYPPNLELGTNYTGLSMQPYQIAAIVFWLSLCSAFICLLLFRRRRAASRIAAGVLACACAACLFVFAMPASKIKFDEDPVDGIVVDYFYYTGIEQKNIVPDFSVTSYDMDLSIGVTLSASVSMEVDEPELPVYRFTLYRGYAVSSVTDQNGKALEYTQDGDYIEVKGSGGISRVRMSYNGYSPKFFSNTQAVCLPGYFPYYPHSGHLNVYDTEKQSFDRVVLPKSARFNVRTKYSGELFSNLTGESNTLSGETDGLTLLSGFLKERFVGDVRVIYDYTIRDYSKGGLNPSVVDEEIKEFLNSVTDGYEVKTILILPNLNTHYLNECTTFEDHITATSFYSLPDSYKYQYMDKEKFDIEMMVHEYRNLREDFMRVISTEERWEIPEQDKLYTSLYKKIQELGEEAVLQAVDSYLNNPTDIRSFTEVLAQIKK